MQNKYVMLDQGFIVVVGVGVGFVVVVAVVGFVVVAGVGVGFVVVIDLSDAFVECLQELGQFD
jgi:hypothetical protein